MTVNAVTPSSINIDRLLATRAQLDDLQRQLGTGLRADNYADLGVDRSRSLDARGQLAAIDGFQESIRRTEVDISLLSSTLERLDELASETKGDATPSTFVIETGNQTTAQVAAEFRFEEAVTLLNNEVDGTYLFSGLSGDTEPVARADDILEGVGARAGFRTVSAERLQADLGGTLADANLTGRLDVATVGAITSITEAGGNVFGFQFDTVAGAGTTSPNINVTGPAGAPEAVSFEVAGAVTAGETVRFSLTLPDGSSTDIVLTATDDTTGPENTFLIDADPLVTAANLETAIESALDGVARRDLAAASAVRAGADFFDNNPPLRVVPDPGNGIAGATTVVADPTNTVIWYQGEDGPLDARLTKTSRIDDGLQVAFGARANEDGLRTVLRDTAVFAIQNFDVNDETASDRYAQLSIRTRESLDDPSGQNLPRSIALEVGTAANLMESTRQRHVSTEGILNDVLADTDGISQEQVAAQILALQTRLEASFAVTSILSELSLVNFLR